VGFWQFVTGAAQISTDMEKESSSLVKFDSNPQVVNGQVQVFSIASDPLGCGQVDRDKAMSVPAVASVDMLIAITLGQLPCIVRDAKRISTNSELLSQPEIARTRSVTMTQTVRDLLFDNIAWWKIEAKDALGYPTKIRRLDPSTVSVNNKGEVRWGGNRLLDNQVIRFDGPNASGLLVRGARAISTCLLLDQTAAMYARDPQPLGYFSPAPDAEELSDTEAREILDDWERARLSRSTGFLPGELEHHATQFNPKQLQLQEARQHAVLEIARTAGVDPEDLGVSTTSRTYQNSEERQLARITGCLGGYIHAIEERLSMGDVTQPGFVVKFNLDAFLRASTGDRYAAHAIGLDKGFITLEEVRDMEDRPALTIEQIKEAASRRSSQEGPTQ
jgi:phage portal protein BeeE